MYSGYFWIRYISKMSNGTCREIITISDVVIIRNKSFTYIGNHRFEVGKDFEILEHIPDFDWK